MFFHFLFRLFKKKNSNGAENFLDMAAVFFKKMSPKCRDIPIKNRLLIQAPATLSVIIQSDAKKNFTTYTYTIY